MNEAIPPVSSTSPALSYQTTDLQEIHRLNRIIKHMYSQAEMDEVMAINTKLEEANNKWERDYNVRTSEVVSCYEMIKDLNGGTLDGLLDK